MASKPLTEKHIQNPERRILLIGKTGAGKSATGNSLTGLTGKPNAFSTSLLPHSETLNCSLRTADRFGYRLVVVDTPGSFDTKQPDEAVRTELIRACALLSPGFHAVVLVLRPGRHTAESQDSVDFYFKLFGHTIAEYMFIVMTHWDEDAAEECGSLENYFSQTGSELMTLLDRCGGRCFPLNNKANREIREQKVEALVDAINAQVEIQGGKCFANSIFLGMEAIFCKEILKITDELSRRVDDLTTTVKEMRSREGKPETKQMVSFESDEELDVYISSSDAEIEERYEHLRGGAEAEFDRDEMRQNIQHEKPTKSGLFGKIVSNFRGVFKKRLGSANK